MTVRQVVIGVRSTIAMLGEGSDRQQTATSEEDRVVRDRGKPPSRRVNSERRNFSSRCVSSAKYTVKGSEGSGRLCSGFKRRMSGRVTGLRA